MKNVIKLFSLALICTIATQAIGMRGFDGPKAIANRLAESEILTSIDEVNWADKGNSWAILRSLNILTAQVKTLEELIQHDPSLVTKRQLLNILKRFIAMPVGQYTQEYIEGYQKLGRLTLSAPDLKYDKLNKIRNEALDKLEKFYNYAPGEVD